MPTNNNKNYINTKFGGGANQGKTYQYYDKSPELELVLARAVKEGFTIPNQTVQIALDQYIKTLKSNGIWYKQDIIFNFAYNNTGLTNFSRINLKNPFGSLITLTETQTIRTLYNTYLTKIGLTPIA